MSQLIVKKFKHSYIAKGMVHIAMNSELIEVPLMLEIRSPYKLDTKYDNYSEVKLSILINNSTVIRTKFVGGWLKLHKLLLDTAGRIEENATLGITKMNINLSNLTILRSEESATPVEITNHNDMSDVNIAKFIEKFSDVQLTKTAIDIIGAIIGSVFEVKGHPEIKKPLNDLSDQEFEDYIESVIDISRNTL